MKLIRDGKPLLWMAVVLSLAALLWLNGGQEGGGSQEEKRIAEVLSTIAGAGKVEVALFCTPAAQGAFASGTGETPTGAVVVAQGADSWEVRLQLARAVCTLLGLPENAVDVFVMEGDPL